MLKIEVLESTKDGLKMVFDLDGDRHGEFHAVIKIFDALVKTYCGVSIDWNRNAFSYGAYKDRSTEWIYWNNTGELEINYY